MAPLMRFIALMARPTRALRKNLTYIYKETETVLSASVLWASVLQCIRPLRWLPAYSTEYPKGQDYLVFGRGLPSQVAVPASNSRESWSLSGSLSG